MNILDTITHYINGAKVDTSSGRYGDVYNPALGLPVARVRWAPAQKSMRPYRRRPPRFPPGPPRRP